MHVVELALEFKTKLNFFLVILRILSIVLFEFKPHLSLVHSFSLEFLTQFMLGIQVFLEYFLVVSLLLRFLLILFVERVKLCLVLLTDLTNKHTVVRTATVFKEDGEDLPNVRNHGVLFLGVLKTLLNQLIETNRIYE